MADDETKTVAKVVDRVAIAQQIAEDVLAVTEDVAQAGVLCGRVVALLEQTASHYQCGSCSEWHDHSNLFRQAFDEARTSDLASLARAGRGKAN